MTTITAPPRTAALTAPPAPTAPEATTTPPTGPNVPTTPKQWPTAPAMTLKPGVNYTATIATTDGKLAVQLLPGAAPLAVNNFVFLANQGFYKHVPIHRMIPGFMMQSGDPTGTGSGGPGYEFADEKIPDDLNYTPGILAMANAGPNTNGSQFFVMLGKVDLPKNYTIFGQVTEGADILAKINARKVVDNGQGEPSKPAEPIFVEDVTITETPIPAPKPGPAPVPAPKS